MTIRGSELKCTGMHKQSLDRIKTKLPTNLVPIGRALLYALPSKLLPYLAKEVCKTKLKIMCPLIQSLSFCKISIS